MYIEWKIILMFTCICVGGYCYTACCNDALRGCGLSNWSAASGPSC